MMGEIFQAKRNVLAVSCVMLFLGRLLAAFQCCDEDAPEFCVLFIVFDFVIETLSCICNHDYCVINEVIICGFTTKGERRIII